LKSLASGNQKCLPQGAFVNPSALLGIYWRAVLRVAVDHEDGFFSLEPPSTFLFPSMDKNGLSKVRLRDCTLLGLASRVGQ
jgi:hypothetical protein